MARYAEVIVDISHSELDRVFDYRIPEGMVLHPGDRVFVPFGGQKRLEGFVLELKESTDVPAAKVRDIVIRADASPLLTEELIQLARQVADRYHCHLVDALRLMLPPRVGSRITGNKVIRKVILTASAEQAQAYIQNEKDPQSKRCLILQTLIKGETEKRLLVEQLGNIDSQLTTLTKQELIRVYDEEVRRSPYLSLVCTPDSNKLPSAEQKNAIDTICRAIDEEQGRFLLKGVTGSGKTEVYLQAILHCIKLGRAAIVLVPEIALTPQAVSRFRSRFGERVAVLHSALSQGERTDEWRRIREGDADVIVGARSAVFAPCSNIGLIIVDEEHETSYRSETTPKYDAIEVAGLRTAEGVLVLGSATPSVERYYECIQGEYTLLEMPTRINGKPLPRVDLVDMRNELRMGNRGMFSDRLKNFLRYALEANGQAILFLNRRGYSTFVMCRECGYVMNCGHCDAPLTFHHKIDKLKCHYCSSEYDLPNLCPSCGSKYIKYFGTGTQKIEEEVKKLYPEIGVLRMDMDTVKGKDAHLRMFEEFGAGKARVLVGTQMVSKGLDFPNVLLVGVIAADTGLFVPDYRSAERTFQLITQVAGRAGRDERQGRVIVQTYSPEHYSIRCAAGHDYESFYAQEIEMRRRCDYPPFGDLFRALFSSSEEATARAACLKAKESLDVVIAKDKDVLYFDAMPAPMNKLKDSFRWQIILRIRRGEGREELYRQFIRLCDAQAARTVFVSVDMNANIM